MSDEPKSEVRNQRSKILYLFTRTPLHVGAGASVGAIDQPIVRERHTGFPIIPATSLKGTFADAWLTEDMPRNDKGERVRVKATKEGEKTVLETTVSAWLFGSDDANNAWAGALQFSEAKLLAFPIRSAKGSFAWITCPLILRRGVRDGALKNQDGTPLRLAKEAFAQLEGNAGDGNALLAANGPLALRPPQGQQGDTKAVLEEYTFTHQAELPPGIGDALQRLLHDDEVWNEVGSRLVILGDGMMSFFAQNACEVAQHVRINDETGTAAGGALFNQENVPSETLFYSVLHAFDERMPGKKQEGRRPALLAIDAFKSKLESNGAFQFGGDASTGLGYCTVKLDGENRKVVK